MQLFILRHGQAESLATSDYERQLTDQGRKDVASVIKASLTEIGDIAQVWVSPLVRAQETAAIVGSLLGVAQFCTTELLAPDADQQVLFEQLQQTECDKLLLVSHQPLVSKILDSLCGIEAGYHTMETSSLACVDVDVVATDMGKLCWLRHASN